MTDEVLTNEPDTAPATTEVVEIRSGDLAINLGAANVVRLDDWDDWRLFLREVALCVFVHGGCRVMEGKRLRHVATAGGGVPYIDFLCEMHQLYWREA